MSTRTPTLDILDITSQQSAAIGRTISNIKIETRSAQTKGVNGTKIREMETEMLKMEMLMDTWTALGNFLFPQPETCNTLQNIVGAMYSKVQSAAKDWKYIEWSELSKGWDDTEKDEMPKVAEYLIWTVIDEMKIIPEALCYPSSLGRVGNSIVAPYYKTSDRIDQAQAIARGIISDSDAFTRSLLKSVLETIVVTVVFENMDDEEYHNGGKNGLPAAVAEVVTRFVTHQGGSNTRRPSRASYVQRAGVYHTGRDGIRRTVYQRGAARFVKRRKPDGTYRYAKIR